MKNIISILSSFLVIQIQAQITKVNVQASGLTCSMCNKSIHSALNTIANVKSVTPDLNTNSFAIIFKDSSKVNYDELKEKIEKAGYKVAKLNVYIKVKEQTIQNDTHITIDSANYHFVNVKNQSISGDVVFTLIDKGFLSTKEYKKYSKLTKMACYQTGTMESCCTKTTAASKRIFHITI